MKKFFMLVLCLSLGLTALLGGCGKPDSPATGGEGENPAKTVYEEVYLKPGETYNLYEQLKYEGENADVLEITVGNEKFAGVKTASYDSDNITVSGGIITAKQIIPDDLTCDEVSYTPASDATLTVIVKFCVVNVEKYGDTLLTPSVGRLYGKKAVFLGDSITDQSALWWKTNTWTKVDKTGKYVRENTRLVTVTGITENYVNMLDTACNFASLSNPAVAGALCSYYDAKYANKSYSIPMQIKNNEAKIADADYVFVMGGTNDSYEINKDGAPLKLGEITDVADETAFVLTDATKPLSTFYGFYNYILSRIKSLNETAGVICLSNIPCMSTYGYSGGRSNGHNNEGICGVNEAVKNCTVKNKVCYVDIYSAIPSDKDGKYNRVWFTNDELHPNQVAYELITDKILSDK